MVKNKVIFCVLFIILVLTSFVVAQEGEISTFIGIFSDYGVDIDGNGLYDFLVIEAEVNIAEAGNYEIEGEISDQSGREIEDDVWFEQYFDVGTHVVRLDFGGREIYRNGENGPYILEEIVLSNVDEGIELDELHSAHTTHAYDYIDFERPGLEVIGEFTDRGEDTNKNGLFDYLIIKVPIKVSVAGNYWLEAEFGDIDLEILEIYEEIYLNEEDDFIYLIFSGKGIHAGGEDGPYELEEFEVWDENADVVYSIKDEYYTSVYSYIDFEQGNTTPLKVDIIIPTDGSTIKGDFISLVVETSENTVCEYGLGLFGPWYGGASRPVEMEITGGNFHMQQIENFEETQEGENYKISVTCKDEFGKIWKAETSFYVDLSEIREILILEDIGDYEYVRSRMRENEDDQFISKYDARYYNNVNRNFYDVEVYELVDQSFFEELLEEIQGSLSVKVINENNVYFLEEGDGDYGILWFHDNLIVAIAVNNFGEEEPLFSQLAEAYLEKYPSDLFDTTSPTIELISPKDEYVKRTSKSFYEIDFKYKVSDESEIVSCSLIIDGEVYETQTNIQKDVENLFSVDLDRGSYDWQIKCVDSEGNEASSEIRDLRIKKRKSSTRSYSSDDSYDPYYESIMTANNEGGNQEPVISVDKEVIELESKPKEKGFFQRIIDWFLSLFGFE